MSVAELATCVRYRLPVKVIVLNNGSLAQIKWGADALPRKSRIRLRT